MPKGRSALEGVVKIELESFNELALLASMMPIPIINYSREDKTAFMVLAGIGGTALIYFCKLDDEPAGRFMHVDKVSARVSFGDRASLEPNHVSIPILRVKGRWLSDF